MSILYGWVHTVGSRKYDVYINHHYWVDDYHYLENNGSLDPSPCGNIKKFEKIPNEAAIKMAYILKKTNFYLMMIR